MSDLTLYVYDLSKGLCKQFSAMFLGRHFDGIWHTGVVAFGKEWFFGNDGIQCCAPKNTVLGEPDEMIPLGKTDLSEDDYFEIIGQLSESTFKIGSYNLLEHNCNNFSNNLSQILVGKTIPDHILDLPKEIMNTTLGPMLKPFLEKAADPLQPGMRSLFDLKTHHYTASNSDTVDNIPNTIVLFKPTDFQNDLENLLESSKNLINAKEFSLLTEINEFLKQKDLNWSISKDHINLFFELYLNKFKDVQTKQLTILKAFQRISLHKSAAELIIELDHFVNFYQTIKNTNEEIKYFSIQLLSNLSSHSSISKTLLMKHQDKLFNDFSDNILIEAKSDHEKSLQESSVSFFYNMISAYHLENLLNESNSLTMGVALLEILPKVKLNAKYVYQMLCIFRSCLCKSNDLKDLSKSVDFDIGIIESKIKAQENDENNNSSENMKK